MAKIKIKDTYDYIQQPLAQKWADFEIMSHADEDNDTVKPIIRGTRVLPIKYLNPDEEDRKQARREAEERKELEQMARQWGWRTGRDGR